jgi:hypothetical protein
MHLNQPIPYSDSLPLQSPFRAMTCFSCMELRLDELVAKKSSGGSLPRVLAHAYA